MPGFLEKWLPSLIAGGASAVGSIIGGQAQAHASDRAAELQSQSARDQLSALLSMYGLQRNDLAPYRQVGTNALSALQNWDVHGKNPIPQVDFSKFKPNQVSLPPALQRLGGGGNALSVGGGTGDGTPTFNDLSTKGIHSRAGGFFSNAATGAGIGATAGSVVPGVGTAVGAAAGAVYGGISGLFDNNNSDKNFARDGINRVSDWTWNTLVPKLNSGEIGPDEAESAFNNVWSRWEDSMRKTPQFNSGVADKSIASQRAYFQPFWDLIAKKRGGGTAPGAANPLAVSNPWQAPQQNALRGGY